MGTGHWQQLSVNIPKLYSKCFPSVMWIPLIETQFKQLNMKIMIMFSKQHILKNHMLTSVSMTVFTEKA